MQKQINDSLNLILFLIKLLQIYYITFIYILIFIIYYYRQIMTNGLLFKLKSIYLRN